MRRSRTRETLVTMRALLLVVLVLSACTNQPSAATSPSPSPTASPTPTPSPNPTASPTPSPSPIALPSFAQLSAPSGTVVWALVAGTRLFRSSDRGDTWVERTNPNGLPNVEVSFADDTNGLALTTRSPATQCQTQTASIWKTVDGAASWQQVTATGIADAMCKGGLSSADATHAFFSTSSPNAGSLIYRTEDGGASWKASAPFPIPANLASHGAQWVSVSGRPKTFGSVVLVAAGAGQTKDVFRSTDAGATFAYASTVEAASAVAYPTATRWLQIEPHDANMETLDAGATWHPFATDYAQAAPIAPEITFGDASVAYATVRGAIQRTTDGGAHWTTIKTPGT